MTNSVNIPQRFYVETDASIDDIHKLGFYPIWDYHVKKFYFYDHNLAEELQSAISTEKNAIAKESVVKPIAINYKYLKFIIEAITYIEWILGIGVPLGILIFIVGNPIPLNRLGMVVAEINVVLMGLVIILFAITIGKVYLKNQYNKNKI